MIKDRDNTERRILDAVGRIVVREGFEAVRINAVATESGMSKILIYRYFGSIDGLLAKYLEDKDFWLNFDFSQLPQSDVKAFSKQIFRAYINMLRSSPALLKLYRWELSSKHPSINELRNRREATAMKIIASVCELSGESFDRVAGISTLVTASVSYLCILGESCGVYNSLQIDSDSGWEKLFETIDFMFDKIL